MSAAPIGDDMARQGIELRVDTVRAPITLAILYLPRSHLPLTTHHKRLEALHGVTLLCCF